jgi:hypothetical protein
VQSAEIKKYLGNTDYNGGQIQPSFICSDVGNIGYPDFIRSVGMKILMKKIWSHRPPLF